MYFPIGWPKYLSVGQGKKSCLKCVVCNRYRMLFAVLTETTVSIWHCRPCVEIVCYQRCHASVASVGTNEMAEWRQDSSMLAVTTTEGYLLLYQLEQDVKGDKGLNLYEYQQTKTNQGDANEVVPALRLTLKSNVNYKVPVTSLSCVQDELLVALMDGRLEILSWSHATDQRKSVALCDIPFSMDMHLSGTLIRARNVCPIQAVYSPFLEGFALVLSDGRAALVAMTQSSSDNTDEEDDVKEGGWKTRGIWAPGMVNATCVAVNNKYRLLAFGTSIGDCCVYAIDDVTGSLTLSHTISLSPTQYPNICKSVGAVLKMEWSPDGSALALSWLHGGVSVWSVFGSCLFCTLASDRSHSSDGTPYIQGVFRSMCWGVEGYTLWLIGSNNATGSSHGLSKSVNHEGTPEDKPQKSLDPKSHVQDKVKHNHKKARRKLVTENGNGVAEPASKINIEVGQLLQIQFAKSALAMNPCMSNHCHVLMHSEDKIYLSLGERPQTYSFINPDTSDKSHFARRDSSIFPTYSDIPNSPKAKKLGSPKHGSPRRKSVPASNEQFMNQMHQPQPSVENLTNPNETTTDGAPENNASLGSAVANKQWTIIQFPLNYLPSNWPIRFAAVDETGCFLAIAGNFGLAHYTVTSRKWKVFGNIMQEKDMVVTGGLTWWQDYVVVACFNLSENQDEIRLYPRLTNLDNAFACIKKVRSQILLVNIFQNLLILFTYDCRICVFVLSNDPKNPRSHASVRFLQEVSMARYVPYPTLVASVTLTALHMESAVRRSSSSTSFCRPQRETEVLIINVAGRLLLLQGSSEEEEAGGPPSPQEDQLSPLPHERRQTRFTAPVVLASCVENIWTTQHKNRAKVHLTDALWLGCGGAGVRVWLPLFPPRPNRHNSADGGDHRGFELQLLTARRITLAFSLDSCYPLAVLFNEAVVLGVTSETLQGFDENLTSKRMSERNTALQFSTIERTCEIYLHQILRQLLRRNLGYHALQLASTCQNLSCFSHVLELMLHEVLEEEATASEPIPDPLLPTVIKFLEEFPQYLETVVHCARKTEIALWEYLFNSVGSPRELFEECLENGQLRTAASYLIILQNLEQLAVARQDATQLFDLALQKRQWALANEIARFLRAIGDGDACATPRHPTLLNVNIYPAVTPGSHHNTPTEPADPTFKFSDERKNLLTRQYSVVPVYETVSNTQKQRRLSTKSAPPTPAPQTTTFQGCSGGKTQPSNPSSPDDNPPVSAAPPSRRLTARSYTESYFDILPNTKTSSAQTTVTSPGGQSSTGTSISHPYVSRYQMRQYHQEHYPMHRPLQHSTSHPISNSSSRSKRFSGDKDTSKEHVAAECAEHYFLDVILARQARKMMSDHRLHDLGTFAACVNFQLVPWLRKERGRACRVDDAVLCLKTLHSDFSWPYPSFFSSKPTRGSNSSGGTPSHSRSFNDLGSLQSRLAAMEVQQPMSPSRSTNFDNVIPRTRNPGLKFSNLPNNSPKRHTLHLDNVSLGTDEDGTGGSGVLTVLSARETGSTLTLTTVASEMSEVSESSLTMDDSSFGATTEDMYGFMMNGTGLDDKRGPARCEMKLQYLLELFLEALCLEWATILCLMLRDPSHLARLVRAAKLADPNTSHDDVVPLDTLQRTRDCLTQIDKWAVTECAGYKAVLLHSRNHLQELYDVINDREVAHAEQQAIVAKQQVSGSQTTVPVSNISIDRNVWATSTQTNATVATTTTATISVKRKIATPGGAQQLTDLGEVPSVNGNLSSDSELEEDETDSVRSVTTASTTQERTRHCSEPCDTTNDQSAVGTSHSRTPSSPAKLGSSTPILVEDGDLRFVPEEELGTLEPLNIEEREEENDGVNGEGDENSEMYDSDEYADSQDDSACTVS
uniref:Protein RIC1 homolog n=1 Tax=Phallusia mammillata TaxID=59560 RepID=A0A6F9DGE9_9ASCI|nr:protein RIC1 homolog [Phallusia mammillata]